MTKIKSNPSISRPKKTSSGKISNGRRNASDASKYLSAATPTHFLIFFGFISLFLTLLLLAIFPVIRFSD